MYVAGVSNGTAVYWKNGVVTTLSNSQYDCHAYAITISDNNIYVAGDETIDSLGTNYVAATYWKNGQINLLAKEPYTINANSNFCVRK